MKTEIRTSNAPAPIGPYSQGIKAGNYFFFSGQIAINPVSNQLVTQNGIVEETRQVMENISACLKEAGLSWNDVVKASIFLKDLSNFGYVNEVYGSYLQSPFPARETVEVSRLPKDVNVEISVTAYLESKK